MATERAPAFQFSPADWLCQSYGLSLREQGRLFTQMCQAVATGDRDAVQQWQGTVMGRVYWREKPNRPYIPPALRRAVSARDGGRCVECQSGKRLELDHVVPYSRGGPDTLENLRLLCKPCNRRKGNR